MVVCLGYSYTVLCSKYLVLHTRTAISSVLIALYYFLNYYPLFQDAGEVGRAG